MTKILEILIVLAIVQLSQHAFFALRQAVAVPTLNRRLGELQKPWDTNKIIGWRDYWGWNNGIGGDWDLKDGIVDTWKEK